MSEEIPAFPLEAFFAAEQHPGALAPNPDMVETLHGAEVIFGRDVTTGNQFIVFGRDVLQEMVRTGEARPLKTLVIEIDQGEESDELEKLCALMQVVNGHHDYQASE